MAAPSRLVGRCSDLHAPDGRPQARSRFPDTRFGPASSTAPSRQMRSPADRRCWRSSLDESKRKFGAGVYDCVWSIPGTCCSFARRSQAGDCESGGHERETRHGRSARPAYARAGPGEAWPRGCSSSSCERELGAGRECRRVSLPATWPLPGMGSSSQRVAAALPRPRE